MTSGCREHRAEALAGYLRAWVRVRLDEPTFELFRRAGWRRGALLRAVADLVAAGRAVVVTVEGVRRVELTREEADSE